MTDVADLFSDLSPDLSSVARRAKEEGRRTGGPRTPEGKARSSRNAVRHGLNCPPAYDPDEEAQNAACADWFADGDPRLADPARAAAEAWAWLKRIRAVRAERVWAPLCRLPESIEEFDPEVMHQAVRELQAIDRYERRARAAYHRSLEELDAARLGLVRAPLTPSTSETPRVRERAERLAWWEVADPARAVARCLAESGYVVGGGIRDWLGRGWVWEWELPPEDAERTAAAEGTGSLSVTSTSGNGPAPEDRAPVPVAARAAADCATSVPDERVKGTAAAPGDTRDGGERGAASDRAERTDVAQVAAAPAATGTGTLSAASGAATRAAVTDREPVPNGSLRPPRPTLTAAQRERFRAHYAELAKRTDLWRRPRP